MIDRDPEAAARHFYDIAVVGGGIYGAAVLLEAARRGIRAVLVERADFGGETSWNSLRIVHGGLRYLQTADLRRYRASVREQHWLLQHFPELVEPLPCLMPLFGEGLRRPSVFRCAFLADRLLSPGRNRGLRADRRLARGAILDAQDTVARFPLVRRDGLQGAALWHDASLVSAPRLLMEMLRWATHLGARALNFVEAEGISVSSGRVSRLEVRDNITGSRLSLPAPVVVNCAGPWVRSVARLFDRDFPELFSPVLAFNIFLDRPAPAAETVALRPPGENRYLFVRPWRGGLLLGTGYAPTREADARPSPEQVEAMIAAANRAAPDLQLAAEQVVSVFSGLLPARSPEDAGLASRNVVLDHALSGGLKGLFSISGIKYTTARSTAESVLMRAYRQLGKALPTCGAVTRPRSRPFYAPEGFASLQRKDPAAASAHISALIDEEAVHTEEDLILRRLDWVAASDEILEAVRRHFRRAS